MGSFEGEVSNSTAQDADLVDTCRRQAAGASGKAYPPSDRQREGPDGYKLSRSDDAGDVGREEVSVANETFQGRVDAAAFRTDIKKKATNKFLLVALLLFIAKRS